MRTMLVAALTAALLLGSSAAEARTMRLGFSIKHLGTHPSEAHALRAVAPSMDRVLTAIRWKTVQRSCLMIRRGSFNWERTDRIMEKIARRQLTMVATLKDGPPCTRALGGSNPRPEYAGELASFARRLVNRYGPHGSHGEGRPLREVEVWSEQNYETWGRHPESYARTFLAVERAIRHEAPQVHTIVGGLAFNDRAPRYLKSLFRSSKRFREVADYVGAHTYSRTPALAMRRLRAVQHALPGGKKIVITKHGWSTCPQPGGQNHAKCQPPGVQAERMRRYVKALRVSRDRLGVRGFYWFQPQDMATSESAQDCPTEPKNFYGIYTHAGQAKPSKRIWAALTKTSMPGAIPANDRVRGCRVE